MMTCRLPAALTSFWHSADVILLTVVTSLPCVVYQMLRTTNATFIQSCVCCRWFLWLQLPWFAVFYCTYTVFILLMSFCNVTCCSTGPWRGSRILSVTVTYCILPAARYFVILRRHKFHSTDCSLTFTDSTFITCFCYDDAVTSCCPLLFAFDSLIIVDMISPPLSLTWHVPRDDNATPTTRKPVHLPVFYDCRADVRCLLLCIVIVACADLPDDLTMFIAVVDAPITTTPATRYRIPSPSMMYRAVVTPFSACGDDKHWTFRLSDDAIQCWWLFILYRTVSPATWCSIIIKVRTVYFCRYLPFRAAWRDDSLLPYSVVFTISPRDLSMPVCFVWCSMYLPFSWPVVSYRCC